MVDVGLMGNYLNVLTVALIKHLCINSKIIPLIDCKVILSILKYINQSFCKSISSTFYGLKKKRKPQKIYKVVAKHQVKILQQCDTLNKCGIFSFAMRIVLLAHIWAVCAFE